MQLAESKNWTIEMLLTILLDRYQISMCTMTMSLGSGKTVIPDSRGPYLKSSHWQCLTNGYVPFVKCLENRQFKKKEYTK